jgi:carbon-monoxide dehydrogenase large subunit
MAVSELIGARIRRREDPELITGTGIYVDDVTQTGTLHMFVLRSSQAHARVKGIETDQARKAEGVVAVFTGKDLRGDFKGTIPAGVAFIPDKKVPPQHPIAIDKVRYVGEPVAIVLASSRAAAEDAAERIEVGYEPLPAVVDIEKAIQPGAPLLHEELGSNQSFEARFAGGDAEVAFREAEVVIKQRLNQQRCFPVAIEPRGVLADYKPFARTLTVWSSTQIPHILKLNLASLLGIAEHAVRVIAPEVGGGFGSKIRIYSEELLAAAASRRLGRPVRWTGDRSEDLRATTHGRAQIWDVEAAARRDGTVLAVRATQYLDLGAYCSPTGTFQTIALLVAQGPYRLKAFDGRTVGVFTNKTPTDAYRGAGRPEATYLIERVMDLVARELGKDPVEIRRKNFIGKEEFPYTNLVGLTYDSGDYELTLAQALQRIDYPGLRKQQAELRKQGRYLGIGLSTYLEICGLGPAKATRPNAGFGLWGSALVRLRASGTVEVIVGSSPHGQGHETPFAQIVGDALGVPIDDIEVMHGDTAFGPMGLDTYGSRSLSCDGVAAHLSAQKVRDKARRLAAHLLEAAEGDVVYEGGRAFVKGAPSRAKTIQELTLAAYEADNLPPGMEPTLEAATFFDPSNFVWPFGAHVCAVEVDAETGALRILRYVAVDDCGVRINPLVVDGQIHGGIAQAIGQALLEEVVYGEDGQLKTGTLVDYMVPSAADLPGFELGATVTPSPSNPLGVKGIGEAGTIAATPAVINAVVDALQPFGVKDVDMPASPQKLWQLMHRNGGRKKG